MSEVSTAYEKLAESIYRAILAQTGGDPNLVQHNTELEGRSGCKHQIDVLWTHSVGGVTFKVAVECKHYSDDVEVGHLRNFFGVLHDVGNVKGIFLTKTGYQSGAKKFATYYGIDLFEMRSPTEGDWQGRVKDIELHIEVQTVRVTGRKPNWDMAWVEQEGLNGTQIAGSYMEDEVLIVDAEGNRLTDLHEMSNTVPRPHGSHKDCTHRFEWPDAYFLAPGSPRLKISSFELTYDLDVTVEKTEILGDKIAKAILKSVSTGEIKFVDNNGGVRSVRNPDPE